MAIPHRHVTGKVIVPSGDGASGGTLTIRLSNTGIVTDDSTLVDQKIFGSVKTIIGLDGSVDFSLVPNDIITPANTYYIADFALAGGFVWREMWTIASSATPIAIGSITVLNPDTVQTEPGAIPSDRGRVRIVFMGTGYADKVQAALRGDDGTVRWVTIGEGGGA